MGRSGMPKEWKGAPTHSEEMARQVPSETEGEATTEPVVGEEGANVHVMPCLGKAPVARWNSRFGNARD